MVIKNKTTKNNFIHISYFKSNDFFFFKYFNQLDYILWLVMLKMRLISFFLSIDKHLPVEKLSKLNEFIKLNTNLNRLYL